MLKTSRQTPATNRVHTQLRRRLKRHRPRPRPTITSPSSSPISTSSRSPPLAAPADAASCDSANRRPRRPRSSTTRRPCGGGDAALAMAAPDVAVTCLHEKAADALLGARLRRAAADATLSCGATRAPSKTPSRRAFLPRRRAGASPSSRRRPSAARTSPSACAPPPRSWTRNIPLLARHPRRSSSLSTSQDVLARTVVLLRGPAGQQ